MGEIRIIENRSEIAAGTRGASLGVDAMKIAAFNANSDFFNVHKGVEIQHENHLLWEDVQSLYAKHIGGLLMVYKRLCDELTSCFDEGGFPVVLAGDHASAGGTIAGIKQAYPRKRLGVIWIDAHADMHSPYTTPSGNIHGMPLGATLAEDNMECRINDPLEETIATWEKLKNIGGIAPKVHPDDIVFIGVRDTEHPEQHLMKKNDMRNVTIDEVRVNGSQWTVEQALHKLTDCDHIYVSFDVDSMDPDVVSRGTGTPVEKGLLPDEASEIMTTLVANEKVCCFEIVEVNPTLDNKCNLMAETAFNILQKCVATVQQREVAHES